MRKLRVEDTDHYKEGGDFGRDATNAGRVT